MAYAGEELCGLLGVDILLGAEETWLLERYQRVFDRLSL